MAVPFHFTIVLKVYFQISVFILKHTYYLYLAQGSFLVEV